MQEDGTNSRQECLCSGAHDHATTAANTPTAPRRQQENDRVAAGAPLFFKSALARPRARGRCGAAAGSSRGTRGDATQETRAPPSPLTTECAPRAGTTPDAREAWPLGTAAGHRRWAPPLDTAARRHCGALLPGTARHTCYPLGAAARKRAPPPPTPQPQPHATSRNLKSSAENRRKSGLCCRKWSLFHRSFRILMATIISST